MRSALVVMVAATASMMVVMETTSAEAAGAIAPEEKPDASTIFLPFNKGVTIPVAVDPAFVKAPSEHYAEVYGMNGMLVLMLDTFDSNPAAGAHCATGKERYLRLLNVASREEVWHRHVESCVRGIKVAEPVVSWIDDGHGFVVHLTSEPEVKVEIDGGGAAREVK